MVRKAFPVAKPNVSLDRTFLIGLARECSDAFLRDNPFLGELEKGAMSPKGWQEFGTQRYLAAMPFERLLETCSAVSMQEGKTDLAVALKKNLADERGTDAVGNQADDLAHGTWRKDFYTALDISSAELDIAAANAGTREYVRTVESLIASNDALAMAGAVLVLEASIPREFLCVRKGMEITFPDRFKFQTTDNELVRAQKMKNRRYIDDHVVHDAQAHYPDLLDALELYMVTESDKARFATGARTMAQAKITFYDGLKDVR